MCPTCLLPKVFLGGGAASDSDTMLFITGNEFSVDVHIIQYRRAWLRLGPFSWDEFAPRSSAVLLYCGFPLRHIKLHPIKAALYLKYLLWQPSGLDCAVQTYTIFPGVLLHKQIWVWSAFRNDKQTNKLARKNRYLGLSKAQSCFLLLADSWIKKKKKKPLAGIKGLNALLPLYILPHQVPVENISL